MSSIPVVPRPTAKPDRRAGVVLPLWCLRSDRDWGVGEYPDLGRVAPHLSRAGLRVVMTLPLLEPTLGQESPYSPLSGYALDPKHIAMDAVLEMQELGGRDALTPEDRAQLQAARASFPVDAGIVRSLKERWLRACWDVFRSSASEARRGAFESFRAEHAAWVEEYALFRVLKERHPPSWVEWPAPLKDRNPNVLRELRETEADAIGFRVFVQFLAFDQLERARAALAAEGVALGGDQPFLTATDSADVWAEQHLYRFDATVGAPPDAFSDTGQEWGLPPYRWDRIARGGYALFEARGRYSARLYDLLRVDHVVGLYRTYHRPLDKTEPHYFYPAEDDVPAQLAQGEAVLKAMAAGGVELIAEDLGVIPEHVRDSLDGMALPGFKVLRWEVEDGALDPASWPAASVATTGTHDTEATAVWWESLSAADAEPFHRLPQLRGLPVDDPPAFTPGVMQALLQAVYESPSDLVLIPIGDLFGDRSRINLPNTVGSQNWSWRLPWSLETFAREDHLQATLSWLRELAEKTERA